MSRLDTGIDALRSAVNLFSNTREDFNQQFTTEGLMRIYAAYRRSGWDITPDEWTERQVQHALLGIAPRWNRNEQPNYYSCDTDYDLDNRCYVAREVR